MARTRFDQAYYERFYEHPATRAGTVASAKRHAAFVASYLRHLELPVSSILDLGCGLGRLLRALGREFPKASTTGVDVSEYLCERYRWEQASAADYAGEPVDLVVCIDVLSYLNDEDCSRALANIARLAKVAAVVSVVTEEDRSICDFNRTDRAQQLRPAAWYRRRLSRSFQSLGGGLYLKKPAPVYLWTLDQG